MGTSGHGTSAFGGTALGGSFMSWWVTTSDNVLARDGGCETEASGRNARGRAAEIQMTGPGSGNGTVRFEPRGDSQSWRVVFQEGLGESEVVERRTCLRW